MDKANFAPLSGFRDSLGPTKSWVIRVLEKVFQQYGYQALETPALERQEILLGKLGDEGQKQLYLFEDNGSRPVGLRYDLTVPLSRYVAGNLGQLALPFKRYEIGPAWRAEKAQKGRYRQFTQADVDIIGAPEPSSELELLSVAALAAEQLKVELTFELNDRRVVAALLDYLKVKPDVRPKLLILLDKRDKLAVPEFNQQLTELGLSDVEKKQIATYFLVDGAEAWELTKQALGDVKILSSLEAMIEWTKKRKVVGRYNPAMVRGLDYYTGAIFEMKAANYDGGTVVAGGRYDNLIEGLTGQKVPGVGISFGVDRLADLLDGQATDEAIFIARLPETTTELNPWVRELRQQGKNVEVYLDSSVELGKQIKYADKRGYKTILIPLASEWKNGEIVRKNLDTGRQEAISRASLLD